MRAPCTLFVLNIAEVKGRCGAIAQRSVDACVVAFARAEDRKRALVAGYQAHLAKPFDVGELILVVADLTGR